MGDDIAITPAREPQSLAQRLIEQHHQHLRQIDILYLFTTQERRRKGKTVLATTQALNPLQRYLASEDGDLETGPLFLILLGLDAWQALTKAQRLALVDHELSHVVADDEGELRLVGHDVEEFASVIARHGLWLPDLRDFGAAVRQLPLDLDAMPPKARGRLHEVEREIASELRTVGDVMGLSLADDKIAAASAEIARIARV